MSCSVSVATGDSTPPNSGGGSTDGLGYTNDCHGDTCDNHGAATDDSGDGGRSATHNDRNAATKPPPTTTSSLHHALHNVRAFRFPRPVVQDHLLHDGLQAQGSTSSSSNLPVWGSLD